MPLCPVCTDAGDFTGSRGSSFGYTLKLAKLQEGKSRGCKKCTLFFDGFFAYASRWRRSPSLKKSVLICAGNEQKWRDVQISVEESSLPELYLDYFSPPPKGTPKLLPTIETASRIHPDPLSNSCRRKIMSWMQDCSRNHPLCRPVTTSRLPKRVLDVRPPDGSRNPVLYESQQDVGQYVALSYCWGQTLAIKTLKENLETRKQSIPWKEIPKTLQDAVKLTRRLGLKYIWIDSLCIIQDDEKDWQEQASQMASIYEGAHVTIVATQAADTTAGFLSTRESDHELVHHESSGEAVSTFVRSKIDHSWLNSQYEEDANNFLSLTSLDGRGIQYPLFGRGWCFQERVLSSRLLYVTRQEYFFQCRTGNRCECGWTKKVRIGAGQAKDAYIAMLIDPSRTDFKVSRAYGKELQLWERLVADFTSKGLTFGRDKLPALSGIASRMPKEILGDYLAGVWRNGLVYGLLWECNTPKKSARSESYVAPSFSWASITGSVSWEIRLQRKHKITTEVLEAGCALKGVDSFGEVTSGYLRLRCLMTEVEFGEYCKGETSSASTSCLYKDGKMAYLRCDIHEDEKVAEGTEPRESRYDGSTAFNFPPYTVFTPKNPIIFYCVQLILNPYEDHVPKNWTPKKNGHDYNVVSLVVRKSKTQGGFERVGISETPPFWYKDAQETEIVIL